VSDYSPTFQHLGKTYVNPLSVELRIVLLYFWEMYNDCLECAKIAREAPCGVYSGWPPKKYELEARGCAADVSNICWELFSPASAYSHVHIHSEHGCDSEACPSWQRGFEAGEEHAKETVGDWYEPEPLYSI
jgi:hypothetical protein